jgi:hypothetical protein
VGIKDIPDEVLFLPRKKGRLNIDQNHKRGSGYTTHHPSDKINLKT